MQCKGQGEMCREELWRTSRKGAEGVPEGVEKFEWSGGVVGKFLYFWSVFVGDVGEGMRTGAVGFRELHRSSGMWVWPNSYTCACGPLLGAFRCRAWILLFFHVVVLR